MEQVAPGVYVESKYRSGNVGLIVTRAGAVCVDVPMLPRDVHDWRARIRSVTNKPIIMLVQTDYDQVRVIGTHSFKVSIIAHDATWDRMKIYQSEKVLSQINEIIQAHGGEGNWQVRMPDITFSERLILYEGKHQIHIVHGGGHSPATCMVHLPEQNLIFTGDVVFCNQHPSMTHAETKQWLSALNHLRKMPVDTIIPGHGAVCDKEATHPLSDYIRDIRSRVRKSFQSGRSKSETSSSVIPELLDAFPYDESKRDQIRQRIKGGSDRIYDEYRAMAKASAARARSSTKRTKSKKSKRHS